MSTNTSLPTTDLRPLTQLTSVILTSGPFVFLWSYLRGYIQNKGSFPFLIKVQHINSILYSIFSAFLAYALLTTFLIPNSPISLTLPILNNLTLTPSTLGYIYHLSKFYEYLDVLLLILTGHVIHPHMAFHHLTTPYLTYFRIIAASTSTSSAQFSFLAAPQQHYIDDWRVFALANCVHHTIMYAYFGGMGSWLRAVLPVTGYLQLLLGVTVDAGWMWTTRGGRVGVGKGEEVKEVLGNESKCRGIMVLLLLRYAMLYTQELRDADEKKKKEEEAAASEEKDDGKGKAGEKSKDTKKRK